MPSSVPIAGHRNIWATFAPSSSGKKGTGLSFVMADRRKSFEAAQPKRPKIDVRLASSLSWIASTNCPVLLSSGGRGFFVKSSAGCIAMKQADRE